MSVPDSIEAKWPLGPLYYELPGSETLDSRAWATYKLAAADWYINTLRRLIEQAGFDRYLGVEMALDGAFTSINGAFDAAVRGLIQTADAYFLQNSPGAKPTPAHLMDVGVFSKRMGALQSHGFDASAINEAVQAAVERGPDPDAPTGWMEQFRRIRNLPMHQNTAARHYDVIADGTPATVGLVVADSARQPVEYLQEMRQCVYALVSPVLALIDVVAPHGIPSELRADS